MHVALIGKGKWGTKIYSALLSFPDITVSVVEKDAQERVPCDAAIIATPPERHTEAALPYIAQGVPVFIEKPMATTVPDAVRIRDAASRAGSIVFVGHIHLFNPIFIALKDVLPKVGAIRGITCESGNDSLREGESLFLDWLPHDLSMARELLNREPDYVEAWEVTPSFSISKCMFGDVPLVSVMSVLPHKRKTLVVQGTEGSLVLDDTQKRLLYVSPAGGAEELSFSGESPLLQELSVFFESVQTKKPLGPTAEEGLQITRVIAAVEESVRSGAPVVIPSGRL